MRRCWRKTGQTLHLRMIAGSMYRSRWARFNPYRIINLIDSVAPDPPPPHKEKRNSLACSRKEKESRVTVATLNQRAPKPRQRHAVAIADKIKAG